MKRVPAHPKIYHITHVSNLAGIIQHGVLWSDARRVALGLSCELVGMSAIKHRRLATQEVPCHPGTRVGEYVPFYLCPRSIMLYLVHMGNHPALSYDGGQAPIVHLAADLRSSVAWADQIRRRWAFTDRNAASRYAAFYTDLNDLDKLDWAAIGTVKWNNPAVKDGKQAEFLLYESFPWHLVEKIGVIDQQMKAYVDAVLSPAPYWPSVAVERAWYY